MHARISGSMYPKGMEPHRYNTRIRSRKQEDAEINLDEAEMGEIRDGSPQRELNNQLNDFLIVFAQQQQIMQQFQDCVITAIGQKRVGRSR